jgi:hypothetical protein
MTAVSFLFNAMYSSSFQAWTFVLKLGFGPCTPMSTAVVLNGRLIILKLNVESEFLKSKPEKKFLIQQQVPKLKKGVEVG